MNKVSGVALLNELQVLELVLFSIYLINQQLIESLRFCLDVLEKLRIGRILAVSCSWRMLRGRKIGRTIRWLIVKITKILKLEFTTVADALRAVLNVHRTLFYHL